MLQVNILTSFTLTTTLRGTCNHEPLCIEEETEAPRGYYFPRPHWDSNLNSLVIPPGELHNRIVLLPH